MARKQDPTTDPTAEGALVKMVRDTPQHPDGPTEADVHPDEVANYEAAGWRRA